VVCNARHARTIASKQTRVGDVQRHIREDAMVIREDAMFIREDAMFIREDAMFIREAPKKKPTPEGGLKVLQEDVVGTGRQHVSAD
jgi:hypothetical protein